MYKLALILGTSRLNNESQKVAKYLYNAFRERSEIETNYLDLGAADFPMMQERLEFLEHPPNLLIQWADRIREADAVVIVAPEYKNGYPAVLKNFLDYLPAGIFKYKPIAIATVSSGLTGGANCLAQLRLVCLSLGGLVIPDRLMVGEVTMAFDELGRFKNQKMDQTASKFMEELLKYTKVMHGMKV